MICRADPINQHTVIRSNPFSLHAVFPQVTLTKFQFIFQLPNIKDKELMPLESYLSAGESASLRKDIVAFRKSDDKPNHVVAGLDRKPYPTIPRPMPTAIREPRQT